MVSWKEKVIGPAAIGQEPILEKSEHRSSVCLMGIGITSPAFRSKTTLPAPTTSFKVRPNVKFSDTPFTGGSGLTVTASSVARSPVDPQSDQPFQETAETRGK